MIKKVEVYKFLLGDSKKATLIEKIVSRLSLEAGITAVGWKTIVEQETD
jgi:putative Mg2+ transporter-C (MgtC) family protein